MKTSERITKPLGKGGLMGLEQPTLDNLLARLEARCNDLILALSLSRDREEVQQTSPKAGFHISPQGTVHLN